MLFLAADDRQDPQWEAFLSAFDDSLYRLLWREAYRIVRNAADADDVLQEALIKGGRYYRQLRDKARLSSWMYTIVRREALSMTGRRPVQTLLYGLQLGLGAVRGPSPDDLVIEQELTDEVRAYIATLDAETQAILRLKMTTQLTLAAIADRLNMPREKAKARYYRARKRIEKTIREGGESTHAR